MSHGNFPKGTRSNNRRIRGSPQQPHDEAVRLVESADIAAAGFPGDLETDHAVQCAYEIADYIGPIVMLRETQISPVENCQFLRQNATFE